MNKISIHIKILTGTFLILVVSLVVVYLKGTQISLTRTYDNADAESVRSSLYPDNWTPGYTDSQGRFLHDFSYAGYHSGNDPIPDNPPGRTYTVTQAPYNADSSGVSDSTVAIQNAINDAGNAGGGVVYLPAGTYAIRPQGSNAYALRINKSNVVLRGAGYDQTKLFLNQPYMRNKDMILVTSQADWLTPTSTPSLITRDLLLPTTSIPVAAVNSFSVGDWVVIRADFTQDFIAEHHMQTDNWTTSTRPQIYYRKITGVDSTNRTITLDVPTRYQVKVRDNARVYKIGSLSGEVGIENLSLGMRENLKSGLGNLDYDNYGTAGYEVNNSHAINFSFAINSWVRNVRTYRPSVNTRDVHILSNGVKLYGTRGVTLSKVYMSRTLYKGEGGNGYGYTISGNDNLITESVAEKNRHNYDFKYAFASGNVIHKSQSIDGLDATDFHMHLSPANLFDSHVFIRDYLEAFNRDGWASGHGWTTAQSVFWNSNGVEKTRRSGINYLIRSDQFGWGYVIGTKGAVSNVDSSTQYTYQSRDFTEHIGNGANLVPQSLYEDQLNKRLNRGQWTPTPTARPTGTPVVTPTPTARVTPTGSPVASGVLGPYVSLPIVSVNASGNDGNVPQNTIDNNLSTRWSAYGSGQWITYDLGARYMTKYIKIAFYVGNTRRAVFDVALSSDMSQWTTVLSRQSSSGSSLGLETFDYPNQSARYVRITGWGNTLNLWNSYTEFRVFGSSL